MRLYEIDSTLSILLASREQALEASFGEVTPDVENVEYEIQAYLSASIDKVESALMVIQGLEGDAETIAAEQKRLAERKKSLEGNSERLRALVAHVVSNVFGGKIKTPKFTASVADSKPGVNVSLAPDADAVKCYQQHPAFFKQPELNKTAIKMAMENGASSKPAWLVIEELPAKRSLRIR